MLNLDTTSFVRHCFSNDVSLAAVTAFNLKETVRRVTDAARQNSAPQHCVDHCTLAI